MALNRRISQVCAILACLPITLLAQADRISGPVDASRLLQVPGNINPLATPAADQGPVDPTMKLNYVRLMLRPSAAQQAQLDQLLRDQQTPGSPNYRKWLTPEQFAAQFGVSQADIAKITAWMQSQGFDIITVGRGRRFIAFNATAQQIQSALKTELHHYRVNGQLHFANAAEPSVPAAIQPLVLGFMGLDDFHPKAQSTARPGTAAKPRYTTQSQSHALAPGDLAIIYDLTPVYNAGHTGTGQKIAVMGRSEIQISDIELFRSDFGLPSNLPQLILVPGSANPGIVSGDETESDLDLEWSGGIAPNAQVLFVYSTDVITSLQYAIDQRLAPVITYSYGECELEASGTYAGSIQSLAQQGNAEGITWMASSGDTGAAACDSQAATHGLAVQIESALPEVTGVGGLMFAETPNGTYWKTQNNSNGSSALSYIPETVWDESTLTQLASGGGGYSTFYTHAEAPWQVGPGVPAGIAARGVPDVALSAADGHDPYIIVTDGTLKEVGGTSAAAPSFAAMIVLLNQSLGTNGLGNINPTLYGLAQTKPSAFHDITTGGNFVPCIADSLDCGSAGNFGYAAIPGWDPASGLGSVDAAVMFDSWSTGAVSTTTSVTANPTSFGLSASTQLTATVTSSSSATPTGTVTFTVSSVVLGTATLSGSGSRATATLTAYGSQFPAGNDTIEATYGGSNSVNGSSGSVGVSVSVPQTGSAVVPSITPDPVYQQATDSEGYSWFFTLTLTDVTSTSTTLTGFTFNGTDYSSSIDSLFGSSAIPANGTLSADLGAGGLTVPEQVVIGFSGVDASGVHWTQQLTVPFYGMQISAAMQLLGLPDTILRDPTEPADCQWFQILGLQELNGHPVYLQHFYADGVDLSSQIAAYFGSTTLPPLGELLGGVCWNVSNDTLPTTLSYEIDGVDDSGNMISTTATATFEPAATNPGTLSTSVDANDDVVQLRVAEASQSTSASININVNSGQAWSVSLFPTNRTTQWLSAYPLSGTGPATVNLLLSGSGLSAGLYQALLVFQSVDALPQSIAVVVNFVVGTPQITSVLNGASFTNTGLSPGQFFTIFGSGFGPVNGQGLVLDENGNVGTELDGLSVLVNGTPAPLLYITPTQINAIAPYEIADKVGQTVTVQVDNNGAPSTAVSANVVAAAPAMFSLGNGQGAILNQDYSVNGPTNPAAPGSYIFIYATGAGQTKPAGVDGQINGSTAASLPVPVGAFSMTIGGVKVTDVAFAGDAPDSVDGFFQVDAVIPSTVKSGNQPVILKIGNITGPPANVAIK